jgi:hypothetical protein
MLRSIGRRGATQNNCSCKKKFYAQGVAACRLHGAGPEQHSGGLPLRSLPTQARQSTVGEEGAVQVGRSQGDQIGRIFAQ